VIVYLGTCFMIHSCCCCCRCHSGLWFRLEELSGGAWDGVWWHQ